MEAGFDSTGLTPCEKRCSQGALEPDTPAADSDSSSVKSHALSDSKSSTKSKDLYNGLVSSVFEASDPETVSDNSTNLPHHYTQDPKPRETTDPPPPETDAAKKKKHIKRMKDFHRLLGKYHICILPNVNTQFEDQMPMFEIFTNNYQKKMVTSNKNKVQNKKSYGADVTNMANDRSKGMNRNDYRLIMEQFNRLILRKMEKFRPKAKESKSLERDVSKH